MNDYLYTFYGNFCSKGRQIAGIKKGYLSQTANLFVNLKSNTMKNTLQIYGLPGIYQIFEP